MPPLGVASEVRVHTLFVDDPETEVVHEQRPLLSNPQSAKHAVAAVAPGTVQPVGHASQLLSDVCAVAALNFPLTQSVQVAEPATAWCLPATQSVQAVEPEAALNLPAPQAVQEPIGPVVPGPQAMLNVLGDSFSFGHASMKALKLVQSVCASRVLGDTELVACSLKFLGRSLRYKVPVPEAPEDVETLCI